MTKRKNLKNFHLECLFIQPFVTKRFIHQVELEKPKMFKTKKGSQDWQNFYNKNDSKVI